MAVGATARRGIDALGNLLRIVGMLIVLVLVLHIVLTLLEANPENGLTSFVREAADMSTWGSPTCSCRRTRSWVSSSTTAPRR